MPQMTNAAHPRSRGEHQARTTVRGQHGGSSPLARGTQSVVISRVASDRLIPARAGNTAPPRRRGHARSAHPRSRGEHQLAEDALADYDGSSPLARGTLISDSRSVTFPGSSPLARGTPAG